MFRMTCPDMITFPEKGCQCFPKIHPVKANADQFPHALNETDLWTKVNPGGALKTIVMCIYSDGIKNLTEVF